MCCVVSSNNNSVNIYIYFIVHKLAPSRTYCHIVYLCAFSGRENSLAREDRITDSGPSWIRRDVNALRKCVCVYSSVYKTHTRPTVIPTLGRIWSPRQARRDMMAKVLARVRTPRNVLQMFGGLVWLDDGSTRVKVPIHSGAGARVFTHAFEANERVTREKLEKKKDEDVHSMSCRWIIRLLPTDAVRLQTTLSPSPKKHTYAYNVHFNTTHKKGAVQAVLSDFIRPCDVTWRLCLHHT